MLTLTRKPLRQPGRPWGRYRSAALVLLRDGEVLGELLVTEAVIDPISGRVEVRLGLNLAEDIKAVRADAVERPQGPSHEWLAAREQRFDAPVLVSAPVVLPVPPVAAAAAPVAQTSVQAAADDPNASASRYVYRGSADGAAADRRWER